MKGFSLAEEREALKLIYGDDLFWNTAQDTSPTIQLFISNYRTASIQFRLPAEYPERGLPQVLVQARWLSEDARHSVVSLVHEKFCEQQQQEEAGGPILYEMTEFCRQQLENIHDSYYGSPLEEEANTWEACSLEHVDWSNDDESMDEWCIGQVVMDRKSVFQGLWIQVDDENKVDSLLNALHQHRKIGSATHIIAAWRIVSPQSAGSNGRILQDWDDDGEKGGGKRILQLLVNRDIRNVLLVVCRWFGGSLLGPVRFHHIVQAAKLALDGQKVGGKKAPR
ncbi:hypothetical protein GAYE_SCF19G3950 [Galdieria yellowstonensis]|uniref:RWD domain-containing protein n=1 Tax=Galdieria yellowstonensis TaxID=3028027 RepID=A0AAV9IFB9_9RHOD|nr:hypothetical protein GAYE_SCF19G3950 [Galdieria yellowstonensis]